MRPRCFVCCIPIPLLLTGIAVGLVAAIRHGRRPHVPPDLLVTAPPAARDGRAPSP
jgi:hypothetical protein